MSDVSVLSHEYKAASDLSHLIGDVLIPLKKVHFGLAGLAEDEPESLETRSRMLANVLVDLEGLMSDGQMDITRDAPQIPEALVVRLRREHGGSLPYYLDDLRRAADHLRAGASNVEKRDLQLLDELALATDAEASRVFRQLMRR